MSPRVYIESTVISYLTSRPSRDIVYAGHQEITKDWWRLARPNFDVYVSELVIDEVSAGDPDAARRRLEVVAGIPRLIQTPAARDLGRQIIDGGGLPPKAFADATHLAIATLERMEFLVTWNCRHLANAALKPRIEAICRQAGYGIPTICTPEVLMEMR